MKAILTKYLGPTNVRGSRIKATDSGRNSFTMSYDHSLNSDENHLAAAVALANKMKWPGELIGGGLENGDYVFVFADSTPRSGPRRTEKQLRGINAPSDDNEAQAALRYTFGPAWRELSALQRDLLTSDVILLYEEEEDDGNVYEDVYDAAVELRARIGGSMNLLEYAKTLEAGARRRN